MNPIISYHLFATYYAIMIHLILNKLISIHFQFKYSKISAAENGNVKKGVIFSTYSSLIGESQSSGKYRTRMKMLLNWCGADFDGVVSFPLHRNIWSPARVMVELSLLLYILSLHIMH